MTRPDAILHIGFNKCGSTALQSWLGENADGLRAQGVLYRRMDPRKDVICSNPLLKVLAFHLAGQTVPHRAINAVLGIAQGDMTAQTRVATAFRADFEQRVAQGGFDTWVGSSEALVARHMTQEAVCGLVDWLSSLFGTVRVVAYIRSPAAWLVSLYGHHARRTNGAESLPDFLTRVGETPFEPVLRMWEQAVGHEAMDVRLFQEDWLTGSGLVEDFAKVLNLPDGAIDPRSKRLNTSYRSGLLGLTRTGRQPKRPELCEQSRARIARQNADSMAWIESTYFADRQAEFETWTAG